MSKPTVFVTRRLPEPALSTLQEHCQAEVWPHDLPPEREEILDKVRGKDGLLCLLTDPIDGEVMDSAGLQLKVIANCAVGVDNIDLPAATQRGIPVGNTPGILTETTADFTFALLMAAARRVVEGDRFVRDGNWQTWGLTLLMGQDIHSATLGIIGFGRIGQAVARRAAGFDMRVLYYNPGHKPSPETPFAEKVDLPTLLGESDFVSLHTPLTADTHHLIGTAELQQMKPTAILINTARGPIVDPKALYHALSGGEIAAAALDVTEPEPICPDDPLLTLDNLIIAPHIASASRATRGKMADMAVENLLAGLNGETLPNCVNPKVYGEL
ncbi:MAG TPA: D-glycerate dehydrogenase [Anaerolineales bacterium]|nr:D-glycerate dehydrogenase [Anaerolineales bacterium]